MYSNPCSEAQSVTHVAPAGFNSVFTGHAVIDHKKFMELPRTTRVRRVRFVSGWTPRQRPRPVAPRNAVGDGPVRERDEADAANDCEAHGANLYRQLYSRGSTDSCTVTVWHTL